MVSRSLAAVWHPCTQMKHHETIPLIPLKSGKGIWLYDAQGNRYLDAISSWWTNLFGHTHPAITGAIKTQLDTLEHAMLAGCTHEPVIELSERLGQKTNGQLGHAFYASDGASAVEIALKMSFHYWRNVGKSSKTEFVALENSYHGETLGALSVTDVALFKDTYQSLLKVSHLTLAPDNRHATEQLTEIDIAINAAKNLEEILEIHHDTIAAVILEPLVQCATGMVMHHPEYLKLVRQLCDQYHVHLIADEIAVGCGRTGTFFACEQAEIWPDLLTLSKGISGGYLPLSVCLSSDQIYQSFYHDTFSRGFLHSHSFTGNPLACAAANATLDLFDQLNTLENNKLLGAHLDQAFAWVNADSRFSHLRRCGMILAFDYMNSPPTFSRDIFTHGLEQEILIRPIGNTVYIMPPYVISMDEIDFLSSAIRKCV